MAIVEATNVEKYYSDLKALDKVSFKVEESRVFCLLGPNGAGKTSFVKGLLGLIEFDSGDVLVEGINTKENIARRNIAYLPERFSFYPYYTVEGVLEFYASLFPEIENVSQRITDALEKMKISELRKKKVKSLSKGQLQRTAIASLLVGDQKLIILDEPFSGLDPIGIRELKDLIVELKNSGKTIFINTHILGEIENICDDFAILNKGNLLCSGKKNDLLSGSSLEDFFYKKVTNNES